MNAAGRSSLNRYDVRFMPRIRAIWGGCPPVLRALAAQAVAFTILLVLALLIPTLRASSVWIWPMLQAILAILLATWWGLGPWWWLFQGLLPFALVWQGGHTVPGWLYPSLLLCLLLVFGGGLLARVPLYNSNRAAWSVLLDLMPEEAGIRMADLGAGLGGPLAFLARRRPDAIFLGVEASPLVWLVAWLRTRPVRHNCRIRLGSLWRLDLSTYDVVHAFLSPAPMSELWTKARQEMRPGSLLISHSFEIPSQKPERKIPLPGRADACLLLYRIPSPPDGSNL